MTSNDVLDVISEVDDPARLRALRRLFLRVRQEEIQQPDFLTARRAAHQCLACGRAVSHVVLCGACRPFFAHCPGCKRLYRRRAGLPVQYSSQCCAACVTAQSRTRRGGGDRQAYLAAIRARREAMLPDILHRYARGERLIDIARALDLSMKQLDKLVSDARRRGDWPEELRRYRKPGV